MPTRQLKVQHLTRQYRDSHPCRTRYSRTAQIRLNGRWLEQAGFVEGQQVAVEVSDGRLIITPIKPASTQSF